VDQGGHGAAAACVPGTRDAGEIRQVRVLDLFSGIGGFSLGLERAGMTTVAFCEVNDFCRAVLKKHWPTVPIYDDVQTLTAARLAADGIGVDVICGGFPCQDISIAGKGAGLAGKRSGLWYEFHRLIDEIKPRYAVIENVSALRSKGLEDVLGSLAEIGYDAEWHCIPASAVGAPHRRDRIWIVAYPQGAGFQARGSDGLGVDDRSRRDGWQSAGASCEEDVADADGSLEADGRQRAHPAGESFSGRDVGAGGNGHVGQVALRGAGYDPADVADANGPRLSWSQDRAGPSGANGAVAERGANRGRQSHSWDVEPDVGRVAHGVPARVDRLKALGNAVVPQIPQIIGQRIMQYESASHDK
jgi:DNA (cytosine-5)-methyltransferase 1